MYQTDGPRVRFGVGWALLVAAALAYSSGRSVALGVLFAVAAGWAAYQLAVARGAAGGRASPAQLVGVGAASITLASIAGAAGAGIALLVFALVALAVAATDRPRAGSLASAGHLVLWAGAPGIASAAVVLTLRYQIGAVVTLLVLVAVYEASDYVIGSGASNPFEGPLAGVISIAIVTFIVVQLQVPPFDGNDAWAFGGLAAVACPLGQLVASALLPAPDAPAPALRRLDSLLVLAPIWTWLVGLYITRVH